MYTHTGTHIDTLNHFGLYGKIWNQVDSRDAVGVRGWTKSGADKYPHIIARGVLIDVAGSKGVKHLPTSYGITVADLQEALKKQGTTLRPGDIVLTRTGLMTLWPDPEKYRLLDQAGLSLAAAQWLVESQKAMLLGADNFGVENFPSPDPKNFVPVHTYLQAEQGVSLLEALWLEDLAKDRVYEFLFIASPMKMRGATARRSVRSRFPSGGIAEDFFLNGGENAILYHILLQFARNKARASQFMEDHKQWIKRGFDHGVFLLVGGLSLIRRRDHGAHYLAVRPSKQGEQGSVRRGKCCKCGNS